MAGTHLGALTAPLVDGELPAPTEERCWQHVATCARCRSEVERELWVKDRVASLGPAGAAPSPYLVGALRSAQFGAGGGLRAGGAQVGHPGGGVSALVRGAGVAGVAAFALVALAIAPAGLGEIPGPPVPELVHADTETEPAAGIGDDIDIVRWRSRTR